MKAKRIVLVLFAAVIAGFAVTVFPVELHLVDSKLTKGPQTSSLYAKQEIETAQKAVKQQLNKACKGCVLTYIGYDEAATKKLQAKTKTKDIQVIRTTFRTGYFHVPVEWNQNQTYKKYPWIIQHSKKTDRWEIVGEGDAYLLT